MDWDDESPKPNLTLCRAGFALVGLGLALLGFSAAVDAALWLARPAPLLWLVRGPAWKWLVGAPITWTTLIGAYLLWGAWADPRWRQRAGLLLMLNLIDGVQWTIGHGTELGLRLGPVGHLWLRDQVAQGFGWLEFALFAGLAGTLVRSFGDTQADDVENKVRSLSAAGGVLWAIGFVHLTDWHKGWPLVMRGHRVIPEALLIWVGLAGLTLVATLNTASLCVLACRRCSRALAEGRDEDRGLDLLKSRSEMWDDEFRR